MTSSGVVSAVGRDQGDGLIFGDLGHHLPGGRLYEAWEFSKDDQDIALEVSASLVLDDIAMMVDAACAGSGIAHVPEPAARARLDVGQLVLLLGDWAPPWPGLCLYYAGHRRVPAGLRAFIDVLRERDTSRRE